MKHPFGSCFGRKDLFGRVIRVAFAAGFCTLATIPDSAQAASILGFEIAGRRILDNSRFDLTSALDSLQFSERIADFQISGLLQRQRPGGQSSSIRISNIRLTCTDEVAGCGQLPITFFGTFPAPPPAKYWAIDEIKGSFSNRKGLTAGTSASFVGSVNGTVYPGATLTDPTGSYTFTPKPGSRSAAFYDLDRLRQTDGGAYVETSMLGSILVTLNGAGDTFNLNYAEVRVVPNPEPGTFVLLGGGLLLVVFRRKLTRRKVSS